MSNVMLLKDGRREYITDERDFGEFLDRELGSCAKEYYESILDNHESEIDEAIGAVRYEMSGILSGINDELRGIQNHKPLDSQKIEDLIEKIRKMVVDI